MTDQPRAACCVCFRAWAEPGRRRCQDCDMAAQPRAQRTPKPIVDLPEDLSGFSFADLITDDN